ncbi:MAG TPA: LAGLIDADG family homing endonuclease [Rhodoglobus sp.]|nr:LAGLIDADG family homing endonuclease [Rhodoglobus sp.]
MTGIVPGGVFDAAIDELRRRSKLKLYQTDFDAWAWDVLRMRNYKKMREIAWDMLFAPKERTLTKSGNGVGKDLALETPILTATRGWQTMGSVEAGDFVFSESGQPIMVVAKSEVFNNPSFRVVFDDGSDIVCSGTHEWATLTAASRKNWATGDWRENWGYSEVFTTAEIAETLRTPGTMIANHVVPIAEALQFPETDLPLDPYVFGAWLGDGTSANATMTCDYVLDGHVIDRFAAAGFPMVLRNGGPQPLLFAPDRDSFVKGAKGLAAPLVLALKSLGVIKNKHIPQEYMTASIDQRIELLRGLMDTDGWADNHGGHVGWGQSKKVLVNQFAELLTGLGVRYTLHGKQPRSGQYTWTFKFRPWFDPFTPGARKSAIFTAMPNAQASRNTGRAIIAIEPIESVPTQCIQVDSDRHLYLAGSGLVPTHNSALMSQCVLWAGSVWPEGDTVSIISAPSIPQLQKVTFKYLKEYHGRVSETLTPASFRVPGRIDENLGWVAETKSGKIWLATGRKPPDQDAVSMFQGLRSPNGMTYVWFDEAGGMSRDMYTAAEAVQTGDDSRFGGIGNPDNAGTDFQQNFEDKIRAQEYNLHTISVFDTPVFTGERVYPRTTEGDRMEQRLLKALTSHRWVAHKSRIWATGGEILPDPMLPQDRRYDTRVDKVELFNVNEPDHLGRKVIEREGQQYVVIDEVKWDARGKSKVLGEFPGDNDKAFFPMSIINLAMIDTDIEEDASIKPVLGVDIARYGPDESVIYSNQNGKIRLVDSWGKTDTVETARKIHRHAQRIGAAEVRLDATGIGGGVFDILMALDEFRDRVYVVIGVDGARQSPDRRRWANARAHNHDQLREKMAAGQIDLDYDDGELKDQLTNLTYKLTTMQGAVQITPKDEMKTEMSGSPDRLDAVIYAAIDTRSLFASQNGPQPGDLVVADPDDLRPERWYDTAGPL